MKKMLTELYQTLLQSKWKVFCMLLFASLLFRALSLNYSVIDHDESTYLLIASELNKGALLYTDVVDTKPPGIFMTFSIIERAFGKSVLAIRLFGSLIIGFSAFFLFLISRQFGVNKSLSFLSGLCYIIAFSCYRTGLAVNTEIFFSLFALAGLFVLSQAENRNAPMLWLVAGLIIGIGFIFKYVVLASFGAFSLFFLLEKSIFKTILRKILKFTLGLLGVLLPFLLAHLYFKINGRFADFYEIIYNVTSRYSSEFSLANSVTFFLNFHLSYLPFAILFYFGLFSKGVNSDLRKIAALWFILAWIVVILPGKPFRHYYLQLLPAICLIVPLAFNHLLNIRSVAVNTKNKVAYFSIAIAFVIGVINQSYFLVKPDVVKEISEKLAPEIENGDFIVTDKQLQLTNYLLGLTPPSKYVHPSLIFSHTAAFEIDTEEEMNKILDKKPKFIIYQKSKNYYENNERIKNGYHLFDRVEKVSILQINP
jgi:4-amino-4-deoxy-L-arabinose transferase-like glycosyltransferase